MKVLIAEDDSISRRLLQMHLEKWGHQPTVAPNGRRAWELFAAEEFPIVISDWQMPEMDGLELVRRIRATARSHYVYVILLTALSDKADVVKGMESGADDFIAKPFDREELRVRVRAGERVLGLEHTLAEQNRTLRETQAALVQSEKMASIGQLAAGVAHEINNPLAYVTNNVAVLRRDVLPAFALLEKLRQARPHLEAADPALAAEAARMEQEIDLPYLQENLAPLFDKALAGLARVRDIVANLRDFARLDEAEFQAADLNAALASTLEMLGFEIKQKGLTVETALGPLPPVRCHPGRLNQVFLNLLHNAVQACGPGGRVTVRTRADGADGADGAVIELTDNGCGIAAEHLPHIFNPFFTTKPVGEGMGLGLSISYAIVRDHGGTIAVDSAPCRGTTFRIRLPLQPPREA